MFIDTIGKQKSTSSCTDICMLFGVFLLFFCSIYNSAWEFPPISTEKNEGVIKKAQAQHWINYTECGQTQQNTQKLKR